MCRKIGGIDLMKQLCIAVSVVTFTFAFFYFGCMPKDAQASSQKVGFTNHQQSASHKTVSSGNGFFIKGLETRASRRAFFSAPPVIPHTIGNTDQECLSCHGNKRTFRGVMSTLTPHPYLKNCMQCHVKGVAPSYIPKGDQLVDTSFVGLAKQSRLPRAHHLAPPVIPHRLYLHDNCNSCHSKRRPSDSGISGPHPNRVNCMQCHVLADKHLDF